MMSNTRKDVPPPNRFSITGKVKETRKHEIHKATMARDMALLLNLFGKISEMTTHDIGPIEAANEAI